MAKIQPSMTVAMVIYAHNEAVDQVSLNISDTDDLVRQFSLDEDYNIFDDLMTASQDGSTPKMALCPYNVAVNGRNVLIIASDLAKLSRIYDAAYSAIPTLRAA